NAGSVTVGLWRPGTDLSFTFTNIPTPGAPCSPSPCTPGACCLLGACFTNNYPACGAGTWTAGGTCTPNTCPQPPGACCVGNACSSTVQSACTGSWQGANSACATALCPPGNDLCANAVALCDGVGVSSTTAGSSNDGTASCANSSGGPDVWYSYIP